MSDAAGSQLATIDEETEATFDIDDLLGPLCFRDPLPGKSAGCGVNNVVAAGAVVPYSVVSTREPSTPSTPPSLAIAAQADAIAAQADAATEALVALSASKPEVLASCGGDDDMPGGPCDELPAAVRFSHVRVDARFQLRCEVDLETVALGLRNATYNPRRQDILQIRLMEPAKFHVTVSRSGSVCLTNKTAGRVVEETTMVEELRTAAKKVARMLQKCGHPNAKCAEFRLVNFMAKADLRQPVRLEGFARKWERHCMYNPDVSSFLVFYLTSPRCTLLVSAGGKVTLKGCENFETAREALTKAYPLFREFAR